MQQALQGRAWPGGEQVRVRMGGAGKTSLGLQVAAEPLDGSGDGVWLVELAAVTDQDAVAAAISQALRLAVNPGRPAPEALLDALEAQDVLDTGRGKLPTVID